MKSNFKKTLSIFLSVVLLCTTIVGLKIPTMTAKAADEEWKVSTIFGNDMILQRNKPVKIFGVGGTVGGTVRVSFAGQTKTTTIAGTEWGLYLDPMEASMTGRDLKIEYFEPGASAATNTVTYTGVLVGELWLGNGQSNMEFQIWWLWEKYGDAIGMYWTFDNLDKVRVYTQPIVESDTPLTHSSQAAVPTTPGITAQWVTPIIGNPASTEFASCSVTALGFAAHLQKQLKEKEGKDIPVGIIVSAKGASQIERWLNTEAVDKGGFYDYWDDTAQAVINVNSKLYNGMIHQIRGMSIAGILWYQGEANETTPQTYERQFAEYANLYRGLFEDAELPIIYFQLPQFEEQAGASWGKVQWEDFRQTQWDLMEKVPNTYAVCGIDLGDPSDIHPGDKYYFTERAAKVAMKYKYGVAGGAGLSPYPYGIYREGDSLRVDLKDAASLTANGEIKGFEGYNGTEWIALTATIDGKDIVLTADNVAAITSVRYLYATAFTATAAPNFTNPIFVYNEHGLPVAPFENIAVSVDTRAVKSITVATQPAKTEYLAGESFDTTGMVVTASYTDGREDEVITEYEVLKEELELGATNVTITYGGKEAKVPITVSAVSVDSTIDAWTEAEDMNTFQRLEIPQAVKDSKYVAVTANVKSIGNWINDWPTIRVGIGNHEEAGNLYEFHIVRCPNDAEGKIDNCVKLTWDQFTYGNDTMPQQQDVDAAEIENAFVNDTAFKIQIIRMAQMVYLKGFIEGEWKLIGRVPIPAETKTDIFFGSWGANHCVMNDIEVVIGKQATLDVFNGVNMTFADGEDTNEDGIGDVGQYRYFPMDENNWMVEAKINNLSARDARRILTVQGISVVYQWGKWWTQDVGRWGLTDLHWDVAWALDRADFGMYVRYVRTGNELKTYFSWDKVNWMQGHCQNGLSDEWVDIELSSVEAVNIKDFKIYLGDDAYRAMQGDVTKDGATDIRDLVRIQKKVSSSAIYNRIYDLDQNRTLNQVDVKESRKYLLQ